MKEQWRITQVNDRYEVSSFGRVRNKATKQILNPSVATSGYLVVNLTFPGGIQKVFTIHRLVAQTFIPNPEGKPQVNHIDGNKTNPNAENLEWVSPKENSLHAHRVLECSPGACGKHPVRCVETGEVFRSITEAAEATGCSVSGIKEVVHGGKPHYTAGGYHWEYLDKKPKPYTPKPKAMPSHTIKIVECIETGQRYLGTHQAAKAVGGEQTSIAAACRGKQHTSAGFHWRYVGEAPWGSKTLPTS